MTAFDPFEREFGQALTNLASPHVPGYFDAAVATAVSRRQRRWWTFPERWLPMTVITGKRTLAPMLPWRSIALLVLLAILLALVAVVAASNLLQRPLAPYGPAQNGAIVFSRSDDIYVADQGGQNERLIIGGPTTDSTPWFSRDGTKIAFARTTDGVVTLMVADADGANVTALTPGSVHADWSPDSSQLAVIRAGNGTDSVLSIVTADAHAATRDLSLGSVVPLDWVAWRPPDGHQILFKGQDSQSQFAAIYSINADGTNLHAVDVARQPDSTLSFQDSHVSNDGTQIGYSNWEANDAGVTDAWSHIVNIDTGQDRRDEEYSQPHFSPAGDLVVGEAVFQLMVGPTDGSSPARAIGPKYDNQHSMGYEFSPDGKQVMLSTASTLDTYLIEVATGTSTKMTWRALDFPGWQRLAK